MFQGFRVERYLKQPLVWCWFFVAVWVFYVGFTLVSALWDGLVISLAGLFAALLVVSAIMSRRRKNLYSRQGLGDAAN
jgi:pilus assembly protein TadC